MWQPVVQNERLIGVNVIWQSVVQNECLIGVNFIWQPVTHKDSVSRWSQRSQFIIQEDCLIGLKVMWQSVVEDYSLSKGHIMWRMSDVCGSPFTPTNAFTPKCRSVTVHEFSSIDIRHLVYKALTQSELWHHESMWQWSTALHWWAPLGNRGSPN
jgi:hypothetical protein